MSKLIAYVGRNHVDKFEGGGIDVFEVAKDGSSITPLAGGAKDMPKRAGYLAYAPKAGILYSVDERKTDGRGPKKPASTVMSFKVDAKTGALTFSEPAADSWGHAGLYHRRPRTRGSSSPPTMASSITWSRWSRLPRASGWRSSSMTTPPSSSTGLNDDGSIGEMQDVHVCAGYGTDPNDSPQGGGHAQASPHAHIVVIDPSGKFLVVCEKAGETDLRLSASVARSWRLPLSTSARLGTGPRHCAFDKKGRMFMTCEFSSETLVVRLRLRERSAQVHRQAVDAIGLHGAQRDCHPAGASQRQVRVHEQPRPRRRRLLQHL